MIGSQYANYLMFDWKKYKGVMQDVRFEETPACCLKNDMWNLVNFYQSTRNCQNWDFYGTLLSKVEIS